MFGRVGITDFVVNTSLFGFEGDSALISTQ